MYKLLKIIVLCLIFTLITLGLAACKDSKKQKIVLNEVVHSTFYAPQYVALEKGFFEEEGLEIELTTGWGADKSMTALLSNNADIALMGPEASIYVYNQGKEDYAVNFAQLTQRAGNFLIAREYDEFEWEDVRNKTIIGGRKGGMPQMVLEYILKKEGLNPYKDVNIITNISFTATAGAFVSGTGDYTVEFEPTASKLESQGKGVVIESLGLSSGKVPYTTYMAKKSYLENNKKVVEKFTRAIYKAQKWVYDHSAREVAAVILPQFDDIDIDLLETIILRYKLQGTWKMEPKFEEESLDLLQDILKEAGELEKEVEFKDIVDNADY